jgi:hypothetical protein
VGVIDITPAMRQRAKTVSYPAGDNFGWNDVKDRLIRVVELEILKISGQSAHDRPDRLTTRGPIDQSAKR